MEVKNLAIIQGKSATIDGNRIKYKLDTLPVKAVKNKYQENKDIVIVRSDIKFSSGVLEFTAKKETEDFGVLVVLEDFTGEKVAIGYSRGNNGFTIIREDETEARAGNLSNYKNNSNIHFRIEVFGSSIELYINKVLMCKANISIKETPVELRMASEGSFEIFDIKIHRETPKIFVVMQFSTEYNELFTEVIRPVVEEFGYECIRADEYYTGTPILKDIIESIKNSVAIIAEITPDNPNVFYEIGYSHAVGKPTILLCDKKREKLPFDLSSFRTLFYENTIAGKKKVENNLRKYLGNI